MRMIRISWRDAIKRFRFLRCRGCWADDDGRDWFVEKDSKPLNGPYCPGCAVKIMNVKDEARTPTQYYADTKGERVRYEVQD